MSSHTIALRRFSKFVCFSTFALVFIGGMVTSTDSGLSVPDWPLSYGMVFPPMVGGVFYEHGHRMVASVVGLLMLILAVWLAFKEKRGWIKVLGFCGLGAVILQGILGGVTVLFYLPDAISVSHGVLAQIFFIMTIVLAYGLSVERQQALDQGRAISPKFIKAAIGFAVLVFIQLIVAAIMRHTKSGLAIPDFPTMGGYWIPPFNQSMLDNINNRLFEWNRDFVTMPQVGIHFAHRVLALAILVYTFVLTIIGVRAYRSDKKVAVTLRILGGILLLQIGLGIATVLTNRVPVITSLHVVTGAAMLGVSVLLILRSAPVQWKEFKKVF